MIKKWVVLFVIFCVIQNNHTQKTKNVEYYQNLIFTGIQKALNYKAPTDASAHRADHGYIQDFGEYDFVIIGAGVTGSIIASRLSEREDYKILLIEAGNFTDDGIIQFPKFLIFNLLSNYNWAYKSIPQTTACLGVEDASCIIPRGKGVGGGSLLNDLVLSRGHPDDYNTWSKIVNDSSWSYENILKYFKKSEDFHWTNPKAPVNPAYHGTGGLINVEHRVPNFFLNNLFFKANKELGFKLVDYNSNQQLGASVYQQYTKHGSRQDLGSIFIKPFLGRTNLKVLTESYVTKISINNITRIAEEVLFTKGGVTYRVRAKKEVILSAGTLGTPQVLLHSGVGPKNHLGNLNIPLFQDAEVGSKLREHALVNSLLFSINITLPKETLVQQIQDFINGSGSLTANAGGSVGFYGTTNKTRRDVPNLEIFFDITEFSPLGKSFTGLKDDVNQALWANNTIAVPFYIIHVDPKSTGTLRLKSNDPFDYPLINPNLLSDPDNADIADLYEGIQLVFKITETKAFQSIGLKYVSDPLPACNHLEFKSKEYWYCFLRQVTVISHHPISTCPMGADNKNGAIVDSNLKVFGIKKLRIADASVLPSQTTGHTDAPCIMIGEKISDVIKNSYPKL